MNQEELIRRCQQGDREAMGLLYTAMHDNLLAICRRYVADNSTAEDLLHDAFLLIFTKIGDVRSPQKVHGWMRKVVKNVALLYAEKKDLLPTVSLDYVGKNLDMVAQPPLWEETGKGLPITYDELMHIVDTLPEGYRRVFRLSVLEGLSHQQIAALLNIEPHSSSSQLYRAKHLLRQSLAVLLISLLALLLPLAIYRQAVKKDLVAGRGAAAPQETPETTAPQETPEKAAHQETPANVDTPADVGAGPVPARRPKFAHRSESAVSSEYSVSSESSVPSESSVSSESSVPSESAPDVCPLDTVETVIPTPLDNQSSLAVINTEHADATRWHIALAVGAGPVPTRNAQSLPNGIEGTNGPTDSTAHHRLPLTIGLSLSRQINSRWALDGDIRYTLLSSEFQNGNTLLHIDRHQHVRYLGLSLGTTYQLWRFPTQHKARKLHPLSLYLSASTSCDLPLRSTVETTYVYGDKVQATETLRLYPATQWSLGTGLGLHYSITPAVGLFVEPSLHYHFPTGDGIDTWRTAHPLTFSLPIGLDITF